MLRVGLVWELGKTIVYVEPGLKHTRLQTIERTPVDRIDAAFLPHGCYSFYLSNASSVTISLILASHIYDSLLS